MSSFNLSTFKKTVPMKIVAEGETIFKQGCVKKTEPIKDNEWVAQVAVGSEVFNVEIMLDNEKNILDHFCDCPSETEHCKHQVAVFLNLKDQIPALIKKKSKEKAPPKPKKLTPTEAILAEVSHQELLLFVKKSIAESKVFKNQFLIHFADKNEENGKKNYIDLIKSTASSIKKSGYFGVRDTTTFLKTISSLAEKSANTIAENRFKDFAPIGLALIETSQPLQLRMESITFEEIISKQFAHFGEVATKCPSELKNQIFKDLFEILSARIEEEYMLFKKQTIEVLKIAAKEADLEETLLSFLIKLNETNSRPELLWEFSTKRNSSNIRTALVDIQRDLYTSKNLTDKIPGLLLKNLHVNKYRKEYVNHLLAKKDFINAKKILEVVLKFSNNERNQIEPFWFESLQKVYAVLKDTAGLEGLSLFCFRESKHTDLAALAELKLQLSEKRWADLSKVLEKEIINERGNNSFMSIVGFKRKTPLKLGHFYVFDQRWSDLLQMAIKNDDLETYGVFAEDLLQNSFENTYKILKLKAEPWLNVIQPHSYESMVNIIVALQNQGEKAQYLYDRLILKSKTFIVTKKSFIAALKARGIEL